MPPDPTSIEQTDKDLREASAAVVYRLVSEPGSESFQLAYLGPGTAELFGYSPEEVSASIQWWAERVHPEDLQRARGSIVRFMASGALDHVFRFRHKDGRYRYVRDVAEIVRADEDAPIEIVGVAIDVTGRIANDRALRESEERHRLLLDHAGVGIGYWAPDGHLLLFNRQAGRALGGDPEQYAGKTTAELFGEEQGAVYLARIRQVAASGEPRTFVDRVALPDGVRWFDSSYTRIVGDDQSVLGVQVVSRDITAQKRSEEERARLERQLLQSQKLEAIGELAGGVAHDINNVLTTVLGFASVLDTELPDRSPLREDVEAILKACSRGRDLTRNLLGFARKSEIRRKPISINRSVDDVLEMLKRTLPKGVTLRAELEDELPDVSADPTQVQHALLNLAINASDAMEGKGTLRFYTERREVSGETTGPHPDLALGSYVTVTVEDDGPGMDEATRARAFDPFFTTKPDGQGTGLGLSMVYGMARAHGGAVVLESEGGEGTRVEIHLPCPEHAAPPRRRERGVAAVGFVPGSGTVLLVDDERLVRRAGQRMLTRLGFDVLVAGGGAEALELYREHLEEIRFVLLDLMMPGMDGEETFRAMLEIDPGVKVLFVSGYVQDEVAERVLAKGAIGFVKKPFSLQQISEDIIRALSGVGETLG